MKIKEFIEQNIITINSPKGFFKIKNDFSEIEIKNFLKIKFLNDLKNEAILDNIMNDFINLKFKSSKIISLANKYGYYNTDLKKFLKSQILFDLAKMLDSSAIDNLSKITMDEIVKISKMPEEKFNFIKSEIKILLKKSFFLISKGGFIKNLMNINEGIMTANAGDSAQFLFVSRAILAGFNCSNVDVRSSKYDAIIDINNYLLRVQIKGISESSDSISFFDRARGGQGIDYKHKRNIGKRITSQNCDLYVAVDKQVGICYIIPMTYADSINEEKAKRIPLNQLEHYKENWKIIKETEQKLNFKKKE